jgi:predicted ribosome quality control (RQC) complex YloA/Tae2 family protein
VVGRQEDFQSDADLDALFALPLEEFTAARNALAKRLAHDGDGEAAEEVKKLSKPTVPAWAVNQLVRRKPELVERLIESGETLQEELVRGRGGADSLRAAQQRERQALRELIGAAEGLLREFGRSVTAQTLERISETLSAGSKSPAGRAALRSGRLSAELEPAGFEALVGMTPAPRKSSARDELAEARRAKHERERERRRLKDELRTLERRAAAAEREAEQAREAAERAREAADEAARSLADLD